MGVLGVTGKAGVSGRETSVSVSERYDETDSLRACKDGWKKGNLVINHDQMIVNN